MKSDELLSYEYRYSLEHIGYMYENADGAIAVLKTATAMLERELGGNTRVIKGAGNGLSISIVSMLEISITLIGLWTLKQVAENYAKGLIGVEEIKELGKEHRKNLLSFTSNVGRQLRKHISSFLKISNLQLPKKRTDKPDEAITLIFFIPKTYIYIVLNHTNMSKKLIDDLPRAVEQTLQLMADEIIPADAEYVQLYFDKESEKWNYLLTTKLVPRDDIPVPELYRLRFTGFIDLDSAKFVRVDSPRYIKEYIKFSDRDIWKLLADINEG